MFEAIIEPVIIVSVIGLICSILLSIADKFMMVENDDRAERIRAVLPGVNCGVCGYPGCDGYAAAVLEGAPINLCKPGRAKAVEAIAEIMGVEAPEPSAPKKA